MKLIQLGVGVIADVFCSYGRIPLTSLAIRIHQNRAATPSMRPRTDAPRTMGST